MVNLIVKDSRKKATIFDQNYSVNVFEVLNVNFSKINIVLKVNRKNSNDSDSTIDAILNDTLNDTNIVSNVNQNIKNL